MAYVANYTGIRRTLQKKVRNEHPASGNMPAHHSFSYVADGAETGDIRVEIDVDAIVKALGRRAMANKNGQCVFMHGAVKLIASNRKREV